MSEKTNAGVGYLLREIDALKQDKRNKTLRITGIPENTENKDLAAGIVKMANEHMKVQLDKTCIQAAFWVTPRDSKQQKQVIVKFYSEEKKRQFYMARIKLKDVKTPIFINEDLTPVRAKLAAAARKAMKDKKVEKTWTFDGEVFVKYPEKEKAVRINKESDLEKAPPAGKTVERQRGIGLFDLFE